jgi:hypothetical protein
VRFRSRCRRRALRGSAEDPAPQTVDPSSRRASFLKRTTSLIVLDRNPKKEATFCNKKGKIVNEQAHTCPLLLLGSQNLPYWIVKLLVFAMGFGAAPEPRSDLNAISTPHEIETPQTKQPGKPRKPSPNLDSIPCRQPPVHLFMPRPPPKKASFRLPSRA